MPNDLMPDPEFSDTRVSFRDCVIGGQILHFFVGGGPLYVIECTHFSNCTINKYFIHII